MPSLITNDETVEVLRGILKREGYEVGPLVRGGERGADIVARRAGDRVDIEVFGFKSNQSLRSRDFFQNFFQSLLRIGAGARRAAIAAPQRFGAGLHHRAANCGDAWTRLGDAFPELEIWLVDTKERTYRVTRWNDWAQPREPGLPTGPRVTSNGT